MPIDKILGVCAVACHLTAFGLYIWQLRRGNVNPSIVSWLIWTALTVINLASYSSMTADWVKSMAIVANMIGCGVTLVFVIIHLRKENRGSLVFSLDLPDKLSGLSGLVSVVAWLIWRSATVANLIVQGGELAGFYPTVRKLVKTRRGEHPAPWAAWTAGFVFMIGVVVIRWQGRWADLAYPAISLLSHGTVLVLSSIYWRRR